MVRPSIIRLTMCGLAVLAAGCGSEVVTSASTAPAAKASASTENTTTSTTGTTTTPTDVSTTAKPTQPSTAGGTDDTSTEPTDDLPFDNEERVRMFEEASETMATSEDVCELAQSMFTVVLFEPTTVEQVQAEVGFMLTILTRAANYARQHGLDPDPIEEYRDAIRRTVEEGNYSPESFAAVDELDTSAMEPSAGPFLDWLDSCEEPDISIHEQLSPSNA